MVLASCKDDAVQVSITWDETLAYDNWKVSKATVENRLPYAVRYQLRVTEFPPMGGEIPANTTPPITSNVPRSHQVHPDDINVWIEC